MRREIDIIYGKQNPLILIASLWLSKIYTFLIDLDKRLIYKLFITKIMSKFSNKIMSHELNILFQKIIAMNTKKKLMSIALLIASVSAVLVPQIGLINPAEHVYVHGLSSGNNNHNSYDEAANALASVIYYDSNDQSIEDPYEVGWD
jgi:hypothetical protein